MTQKHDVSTMFERLEARLDAIDRKLDSLVLARRKSMEWIATLSEQVGSLDAFREEVRATLEPLFHKIENVDDAVRVLRHAASDISRRIEVLERPGQRGTQEQGRESQAG